MFECRWRPRIERWFDGQSSDTADVERHVGECAECARFLSSLRLMRTHVEASSKQHEIRDAQFAAFMDGIRERVETPVRGHHRGLWAALSLTAAALIVALSTFFMFTGGLGKAKATVVESASSELEGAQIKTYDSGDGVTTVWITVAKDDVW